MKKEWCASLPDYFFSPQRSSYFFSHWALLGVLNVKAFVLLRTSAWTWLFLASRTQSARVVTEGKSRPRQGLFDGCLLRSILLFRIRHWSHAFMGIYCYFIALIWWTYMPWRTLIAGQWFKKIINMIAVQIIQWWSSTSLMQGTRIRDW